MNISLDLSRKDHVLRHIRSVHPEVLASRFVEVLFVFIISFIYSFFLTKLSAVLKVIVEVNSNYFHCLDSREFRIGSECCNPFK